MSIEEKEIRSAERQKFVQGLRECADFLDQHPDLPIPGSVTSFCCFANSKEELASFARSMGNCEKHAEGNYFWIERKFGSIRYEINIERAKVCVRKVVGTITVPAEEKDVVEWECEDSLLG